MKEFVTTRKNVDNLVNVNHPLLFYHDPDTILGDGYIYRKSFGIKVPLFWNKVCEFMYSSINNDYKIHIIDEKCRDIICDFLGIEKD